MNSAKPWRGLSRAKAAAKVQQHQSRLTTSKLEFEMAKRNVIEPAAAVGDVVVNSRRGKITLVSVSDMRIALQYTEYSGGISGGIEGPSYLAIGKHVTDARLVTFAGREGMKAAQLIEFRDSINSTMAEVEHA